MYSLNSLEWTLALKSENCQSRKRVIQFSIFKILKFHSSE